MLGGQRLAERRARGASLKGEGSIQRNKKRTTSPSLSDLTLQYHLLTPGQGEFLIVMVGDLYQD